MMRVGTLLSMTFLCCSVMGSQEKSPERLVRANVLTSERDPSIQIELPKQVRYVGGDRWLLFGIADCEIHVFVQADAQNNVQRLYWLQFEGFIPTRPELKHNYTATRTEKLDGMDFDVRARFGSSKEKPKPGSDLEHVQALIQAKGYKLPDAMMNVRFVRFLDDQRRKELMTIYAEDLKPTGFTETDLVQGGKDYQQWPMIENGLIERAKKDLTFRN